MKKNIPFISVRVLTRKRWQILPEKLFLNFPIVWDDIHSSLNLFTYCIAIAKKYYVGSLFTCCLNKDHALLIFSIFSKSQVQDNSNTLCYSYPHASLTTVTTNCLAIKIKGYLETVSKEWMLINQICYEEVHTWYIVIGSITVDNELSNKLLQKFWVWILGLKRFGTTNLDMVISSNGIFFHHII